MAFCEDIVLMVGGGIGRDEISETVGLDAIVPSSDEVKFQLEDFQVVLSVLHVFGGIEEGDCGFHRSSLALGGLGEELVRISNLREK